MNTVEEIIKTPLDSTTKAEDIPKYTIVCDESDQKPQKDYKYFFGGAMLLEKDYERIGKLIDDFKTKLGLHEMKRTKITPRNASNYIKVLKLFFTFVKNGEIKLRVMFAPFDQILTTIPKSENHTYINFYRTFIKNAFNIFYCGEDFKLRLVFDELPEEPLECCEFKHHLVEDIDTNKDDRSLNRVYLKLEDIEEVDSKKHPILQCVDVIIGCIEYALNLKEGEQPSRRSFGRQQVFDAIHEEILSIIPNFNLTTTTLPMYSQDGWNRPYAHFVYQNKQNLQNPCKCKCKKSIVKKSNNKKYKTKKQGTN